MQRGPLARTAGSTRKMREMRNNAPSSMRHSALITFKRTRVRFFELMGLLFAIRFFFFFFFFQEAYAVIDNLTWRLSDPLISFSILFHNPFDIWFCWFIPIVVDVNFEYVIECRNIIFNYFNVPVHLVDRVMNYE